MCQCVSVCVSVCICRFGSPSKAEDLEKKKQKIFFVTMHTTIEETVENAFINDP